MGGGGGEKLFYMYKFRTMTDERDNEGNLLPDEERLTSFGRMLRAASLDELPQIFNILKGEMSFIGPRPHLIEDMLFMTSEQRQRHNVLPGLSGLAQVNGRNAITWDDKLAYDVEYVRKLTFRLDVSIAFRTVITLLTRKGINEDGNMTHENLAEYLLRLGRVTPEEYSRKKLEAQAMLKAVPK